MRFHKEAPMPDEDAETLLMDDAEVREVLRISESTFYRLIADGPPKTSKAGDIRKIKHSQVGGARRWVRSSVMAYLKIETPQRKEK